MNFTTKISEQDKELFFGPIDLDDTFILIEDHWCMAHVLHASGNFSSISQAKKNGWNKSIPEGFTILTVGKKQKKKTIFIFFEKTLDILSNMR